MGSSNGGAGSDLIDAVRRNRHDLNPGGSHRNLRPPVGLPHQPIFCSVAVTPMTAASAAVYSGGELGRALPTAAISTMPRALALSSISCSMGSRGPAKLMLTMRAFLLAAQSRPLGY